jgi:hypothetical protein
MNLQLFLLLYCPLTSGCVIIATKVALYNSPIVEFIAITADARFVRPQKSLTEASRPPLRL